ncbi:MAG: hypothetical protein LW650_14465 [Planctomycetaceae bacterium]|jgi:hypothetical protein|nr:hypothetical protein [Phycisphaerales bacterium]MCE2654597.1 hypothetical protein [Planctomycetaceae bacterium]
MANWSLITIGTAVALLIWPVLLECRRPKVAAGAPAGARVATQRRVALAGAAVAACAAMAANLIPDAHLRPISVVALLGAAPLLLSEWFVRRHARIAAATSLGLIVGTASAHLVGPISRSAGGIINADGQPAAWLSMLVLACGASLAITLLIHLARRGVRGLTLTRTLTFWSVGVGIALLLAARPPTTSILTLNALSGIVVGACWLTLLRRPRPLGGTWLGVGLALLLVSAPGISDARRLQLAADWAAPPNPIYAASKATPEQVYTAHAVVLDSSTAVLIVPNVYADGRGDRFGRHIDLLGLNTRDQPPLAVGTILQPTVTTGDLINAPIVTLSAIPTAGIPNPPASPFTGDSLRHSNRVAIPTFFSPLDLFRPLLPVCPFFALLLWPRTWTHDHPEPASRNLRRVVAAAAFAALALMAILLWVLGQTL